MEYGCIATVEVRREREEERDRDGETGENEKRQ